MNAQAQGGGGAVAPANSALPLVSGTATQGQTLTATAGSWSGTAPIFYAYQWQRAGVAIAGATSASYVLQAADVGAAVHVVVTASNAAGSANAASAPTGAVAALAVAPTNSTLPVVSGTAVYVQSLSASQGSWTGSAPITYAYQWQRAGVDIAGATAASYAVQIADIGIALRVVVTASNAAGAATAVSAVVVPQGQSLTALPVTPYARWHPAFSTVTASGGRVVSASDLQGLAALSEGAAGVGPKIMTDLNARKFWRFEGAEFLNIAAAMTLNNRDASVIFVGRMHRSEPTSPIFSGGNVAQGSQLSGGGLLDVGTASNSAPFLRCVARAGSLDASNAAWMVAGSQLQAMAVSARTTANGANTYYINERQAKCAQGTLSRPVLTGGEIGRNPMSVAQFGSFDLYEMIVYSAALSDANLLATQTALMTNYAITPIVNQIVLEGDSITQGVTGLATGGTSGAVLAEPGAGRIPTNWRVVNMGASGNQVSHLIAKRDASNGWASMALAGGQNLVAFEIGRNDFSAGALTAAQHYANVLAYLNTASTGVLQRGWTVRELANIGTSSSGQPKMETFRVMIRDPAFLTATQTAAGQTFAGKLSVISTDLIQDNGSTVFLDSADAADTTYYAGDSTHPNSLGTLIRITGGTTPQYGVAYGL